MFLADHLSRAAQHEGTMPEESFQVFSLELETLNPMFKSGHTPCHETQSQIKARDTVFWPKMNAEVRDLIKQCSICNKFQAKNLKQPMQSHQIPDRPWSTIAADQFKLHSKEYIVLVDFYSDFIEVKQLQENTSSSVIEFLKEQFSRYGIPDTLVTDNCPQFTSHEFQQFSRDWEFVHVSSSPHHHRSNGKVE
ncbi:hypothetical protein ACROYT_G013791 [Oculina patagonica]